MLPVRLRGARTHNLRGIDLDLSPGSFVALTGPSGAGKSSLALDTLYAEGQRRFVESFSPYARQFLERRERPPVTSLDPIAATVAVDRRAPVKSSRSTLATLADLEAYIAALFGAEAIPTCPDCHLEAVETRAVDAATRVLGTHDGARAIITYPVSVDDAEGFLTLRDSLLKEGYRRLVVGGTVRDIDEVRPSDATARGTRLEVVVDRVEVRKKDARRIQDAIEVAWSRANGRAELRTMRDEPETGQTGPLAPTEQAARRNSHEPLARGLRCPKCARAFEPPSPRLFSYNSPLGACETCKGFGRIIQVDWNKVIPDPTKTIAKGAIKAWMGKSSEWERGALAKFAVKKKVPLDVPWEKLTQAQQELVLAGEGTWEGGKFPGVRAWFKWLETRTYKMHVRVLLSRYREYATCGTCQGSRLSQVSRSYRAAGLDVASWHAQTVADVHERLMGFVAKTPQGKRVHEELSSRLAYLNAVGLGYLTLDRQARTLSGGESQRAALTTALGARLTGALFVIDEPTVGLHATDIPPLAQAMKSLSNAGNTVLVIEHDESVVRASDRVVELGPGAGENGGRILFDGHPDRLAQRKDTPTGRAWQASARADLSATQRKKPEKSHKGEERSQIVLRGVRANNLHIDELQIPQGKLVAITGPSGSGKSTLAEDVLYRAAARAVGQPTPERAGEHESLTGLLGISRVALVDQSPLGRTARGNAATYTKAWDKLRARFAAEPEAKRRGFGPSTFSFNVGGTAAAGRCEACSGEGYETVEMQFLADVQFVCPACQGKRFRPEVLEVRHAGLDVSEVLALTVDNAIARFCEGEFYDPVLKRALEPVSKVGLGYLQLGQPLSTLSGGEAQRLKLARALSEDPRGTLFVVDEPSAGLHAEDAAFVVRALHELVDAGATVVVVEHDLSVIRACDWVVDMGPGGGPAGGHIVFAGTPEALTKADTKTGVAMRAALARGAQKSDAAARSKAPRAPRGELAISVSHAREHNLKDVSCTIPHGALTVVTGPSGSGKSSLAFDVVYAEGQRRFLETLTPYARQFLPQMPRPDVDRVVGVPPSIALEQRLSRAGANSTVSTVTEIAHYIRLLYAKVGDVHCPACDTVVSASSPSDIWERLQEDTRKTVTIYSPAVRARKGTYLDVFTMASRAGLKTARVDDKIIQIDPPPRLKKTLEHTIDLIVHYGAPSAMTRADFDRALLWGAGALRIGTGEPTATPGKDESLVSTRRACPSCGTGVPEIDPRWFSFNTKQGQCPACEGSGIRGNPEDDKPDTSPCRVCNGERLAKVPRRVRLFGETYAALGKRSVDSALAWAESWKFSGSQEVIARAPHAELCRRLSFVKEVGLGYLSLDRWAATLSGGEMQRLRLSAQLGSGLTGALYVLDEPTIGLHPRDTARLIGNLRKLVDTGSTVIVVEHDAEIIRAADHLLDLGPFGGRGGGHVVAEGPAKKVLARKDSPTGKALADDSLVPREARGPAKAHLVLTGARAHNLHDVTLKLPVGRLSVVCGVSGSGKSTLVRQVFHPALRRALGLSAPEPLPFGKLTGAQHVKRALAVDQSPIGRTPRSVPATFLGIWDDLRKLYASLPEAKSRGYGPGRFSFNSTSGGRCTACEGQGVIVHEMSFLPDVANGCDACGGARFEPATLDVRHKDLSIGDVLRLSAEDAAHVFSAFPRIARPLTLMCELGVGYVQIGQGSNTLSGGEAQRLKLAAELTAGSAHEPTVYVLDEPTTGLHVSDVRKLIAVMEKLVARGDTLVVIEHQPDVIRAADWVVELGPEAGDAGGRVVFEGEPRNLRTQKTPTGRFLSAHA
jgi:excinuclease ABC subunit A